MLKKILIGCLIISNFFAYSTNWADVIVSAFMAQALQNGSVSVEISSDSCPANPFDEIDELEAMAKHFNIEGTKAPLYYRGHLIGTAWVDGSRHALFECAGVIYLKGHEGTHFFVAVDKHGRQLPVAVLGVQFKR